MEKRKRALMLQVAVSERQLRVAHSTERAAEDAGPDGGGGLPTGWVEQPSASRPGEASYVNVYTNEAIAWKPTSPASRDAGNLPAPPVLKRRSKSTREIKEMVKKHSSLTHPIEPVDILKARGVKREASMPSFKETCGCVLL